MTNVRSYLPDGVLDEFCARLDDLDDDAREDVVPHRSVGNLWGYRFGEHRIVAKVYDDVAEGHDEYRILQAMWAGGFGPDSRHRVPEPLAYLTDRRLLLMEAAPGDRLLSLVFGGPQACADGMRAAAGWLAELHASPLRVGPPEGATRVLYSLARRVVTAVERHPQAAPMIELVSELERRGSAWAERAPVAIVQTHGRYHCDHVFVTAETVTVVDLARAAPADPAKDVAEFLTRFRIEALKKAVKKGKGDDIADLGTRVFLEEYRRQRPQPLPGLLYYWSATLLVMMLHDALKPHVNEEARKQRLALFEDEFRQLPGLLADRGWQARSSP